MKASTGLALASAFVLGLTLACTLDAALAPPATASPTASRTQTPQPAPTGTLMLDLTPQTPVPAATVDLDSADAFDCRVRWQTPKNGVKFGPKERFDVAWQIENIGMATWTPDLVRVTYFSGTRMQVNDSVNLKEGVFPGAWTQIVVPLVAPRSTGNYTTVWAIWYGDNDFCHMNVSITVK